MPWRQLTEHEYSTSIKTYCTECGVTHFIETQKDYRDNLLPEMIQEFVARVGSGKVLDIGCGSGADVAFMRARGIDAEGVDISPEMVQRAIMSFGDHFSVADMTRPNPEQWSQYKGVTILFSLIHLPMRKWGDVLRNVHEILSADGIMLVSVKHGRGVRRDDRLGEGCTRYVQLCSLRDFRTVIERADFKNVEMRHGIRGTEKWIHAFAMRQA